MSSPELDTVSLSATDPGAPAQELGAGASIRWSILFAVLAVIGAPLLLWRRFVLKKDQEGWGQKFGHVPERERHGKRIWIHAVSVGEALATWTVYKEIKKQIPDAEVVISTTTSTGQDVARKRYGVENVFYYPLDFAGALRRSFERVKPDLIVLMELEVWPNFTREALGRDVPVVVVNGRITEHSARGYARAWWVLGPSFKRVRRWLMQDDEFVQRIKGLGVDPERVALSGNVKYDAVGTEPVSAEERERTRAGLCIDADAKLIIGGSTHPSEENTLLGSYRLLVEGGKVAGLRLVLVPRHPHRLDDVQKDISELGFACVRRSALKEKGAEALADIPEEKRATAVVLVDTMGELKQLYAAADVAFIGGSLIPHGGQNVSEPAGMGVPTVYGPHMHNFREAVALLEKCKGAIQVSGPTDVHTALEQLLVDSARAREMGQAAREAFLALQGASARTVAYLKTLLERKSPPGAAE